MKHFHASHVEYHISKNSAAFCRHCTIFSEKRWKTCIIIQNAWPHVAYDACHNHGNQFSSNVPHNVYREMHTPADNGRCWQKFAWKKKMTKKLKGVNPPPHPLNSRHLFLLSHVSCKNTRSELKRFFCAVTLNNETNNTQTVRFSGCLFQCVNHCMR